MKVYNFVYISFIIAIQVIQGVELLECYTCSELNEQSCNEYQVVTTCKLYQEECINVTFSYVEAEVVYTRYERRCAVHHQNLGGDCDHYCKVPHHFNSTDCMAKCCTNSLCNSDVDAVITTDALTHSRSTNTVPMVYLAFGLPLLLLCHLAS